MKPHQIRLLIFLATLTFWVGIAALVSACAATKYDEVEAVNREVNTLHRRKDDAGDVWQEHSDEVNAGELFYGDCEDVAFTKARLLQQRGIIPTSDIKMWWVNIRGGDGHMVTVVTIDGERWVMDNRYKWMRKKEWLTNYENFTELLLTDTLWRRVLGNK